MVLGLVFLSLPLGLIAAGLFLVVVANVPDRRPVSPVGTAPRAAVRSKAGAR